MHFPSFSSGQYYVTQFPSFSYGQSYVSRFSLNPVGNLMSRCVHFLQWTILCHAFSTFSNEASYVTQLPSFCNGQSYVTRFTLSPMDNLMSRVFRYLQWGIVCHALSIFSNGQSYVTLFSLSPMANLMSRNSQVSWMENLMSRTSQVSWMDNL